MLSDFCILEARDAEGYVVAAGRRHGGARADWRLHVPTTGEKTTAACLRDALAWAAERGAAKIEIWMAQEER